jgi:predicted  nucleic acid-binding Zn-ribbon protein
VHPVVQQLLNLQRFDEAIRFLGHELQQIPKKNRSIDEKIRAFKEPLEKARTEKTALESRAVELRTKLAANEERERQLKLKIPQVKSNDEYSALLREMDAAKKERENLDTLSLQDMERIEALEGEFPVLVETDAKGEESVKDERQKLEQEKSRLEGELLKAKKGRMELEKAISPAWFRRYNTVAAQRNGIAVAEVKNGVCQGCYTGIRPKLVQDLHASEEVVTCEGCARILCLQQE